MMSKEELKNKRYYDEKQDLWVVSWNAVEKYLSQQAKELKEIKTKTEYLLIKIQNIFGFKALYNRNLDFSVTFDKLKKLVGEKDE
jgi:hypothetical protein